MANNIKKIISYLLKVLYYIALSFICLLAFFLIFYIVSAQLNSNNKNYKPTISLYTIVSPSMTPVIKVYDVVVNKSVKKPEDVQVGDIITYISSSSNSNGMTITHRVIEIVQLSDGSYEYLTQGDNNSNPDALYVPFNRIIGKEIFIIPQLGRVQFLIASKKSWLLILLFPILFFLLKDIKKIFELLGLNKKVTKVSQNNNEITLQNQIAANNEQLREKLQKPLEERTSLTYDLPKLREEKNQIIEVLDTDELTSKIKEYDEKIIQLNKLIDNIQLNENNEIATEEETFEEHNDYLTSPKLKVINTENIKKNKRTIPTPVLVNEKFLEEKVENNSKKQTSKLNLNPHDIKRINRYKKDNKLKSAKTKLKKSKFISIEKIK